MTTRREFLGVLGVAAFAVPLVAIAQQQQKVYRIAMLIAGSASDPMNSAFIDGMRDLGYTEGTNVIFERRFASGNTERLPALAAELVAAKPDVIFAPVTPAALAARRATGEIPIVFAIAADPVGSGLAAALPRPGGNATGLTSLNVELIGKRMQLLKELLPRISRVALLFNPNNLSDALQLAALERAAAPLGIRVFRIGVRKAEDYDSAFAAARAERAEALMILPNPLNIRFRARIVDFATRNRLPTMDAHETAAEDGELISYSISWRENYRRAALYVDKILKGANPRDLPIEQPTKLDLVINLKTAKALGITIPPSILYRANRVIE